MLLIVLLIHLLHSLHLSDLLWCKLYWVSVLVKILRLPIRILHIVLLLLVLHLLLHLHLLQLLHSLLLLLLVKFILKLHPVTTNVDLARIRNYLITEDGRLAAETAEVLQIACQLMNEDIVELSEVVHMPISCH